MENIYFRKLNITQDLALDAIAFASSQITDFYAYNRVNITRSDIKRKVHGFFQRLGFRVSGVICFYTPPNYSLATAHVDDDGYSNMAKLNYVSGGLDHWMHWYKFVGTEDQIIKTTNVRGDPYYSFEKEHCEEVAREHMEGYYLVNAGVPHGITNDSDVGRWCLSFGLHYPDTNNRVQWHDALRMLKGLT